MPKWKRGKSGNPKGRPEHSARDELKAALKRAKDKGRPDFLDFIVRRAYYDDAVAVALLKKLVPDMHEVAASIETRGEGMSEEEAAVIGARLKEMYSGKDTIPGQ